MFAKNTEQPKCNKGYEWRKYLTEQIRSMGLELIDLAEDIVGIGEDTKEIRLIRAEKAQDALEQLPSAQPDLQPTCNQLATDCISRQAAIDAIEEVDWYHQNNNKDMVHGANSSEDQAWYKADDIYKTLEALPSAQPERKKGEWKAKEEREKQEIFICSECGGWAYSPWIGSRKSPKPNRCKYAFCPNCGADMRGEEE